MKYPIAERFKAPQGEGVYTGTPMAFIRFVGCSIGKDICHNCDTDFERMYTELGGGAFTELELLHWVDNFRHVCLTGGEPLDRNLESLAHVLLNAHSPVQMLHIETSGTKEIPKWYWEAQDTVSAWLTVSPKPGFREDVVDVADEVKVILDGLGSGPGWPTIEDAVKWADKGLVVYIQPRNGKKIVDKLNMAHAIDAVMKYPQLRLSAQLHKYITTR